MLVTSYRGRWLAIIEADIEASEIQETPATPEPRVPTPLSPVITDRRTSPLKQLHTVTVESAPLQPLPSPGMMPDCLCLCFVVSWILK